MPSEEYALAFQAAQHIVSRLPKDFPQARIGIICGSGLSGLVSTFHADPQISISYADVPNFPVSTVEGHQSRLVFGTIGTKKVGVAAMVGRLHFYEGHDMKHIALPIRVLYLLGIQTLISTLWIAVDI
jgi:purine-nucleoside phosphorylase